MSIHHFDNWARPRPRGFKWKKRFLLRMLIVNFLLILPGKAGSQVASEDEISYDDSQGEDAIRRFSNKLSKTEFNASETRVQYPNAMTCLSSDDKRENNCIQVIQAEFNQMYYKTFNRSLEFRLIYSYSDSSNFAVSVDRTDANFDVDRPIMFVVRQQKAVTSWELPYVLETSTGFQRRYNTYRSTLCPQSTEQKGFSPSVNQIVVDISTSSRSNVTFRLKMSIEKELNVGLEEERRMSVTPSENRIYKFNFPTSVTQVAVNSKSADDICLTVSVQSPQCPVFDTIYNVEYEGYRQTMTGQSTIIVQKDQYPKGFYLVYIVNTDDEKCVNSGSPSRANRTKQVSFTIQETISIEDFRQVIFIGTLGVYGGFVALVIATCLLVEYRRKRSEEARREWEVTVKTYNSELQPISEEASHITNSDVIKAEGTKMDLSCHEQVTQEASDDVFSDGNPTRPTRQENKLSSKRWRRVSEMTKHQPDFYNKKSKRYVSELCIIAVFYLIPVGQLVWNHKDMMVTTGDQDMCYYNFACAYPYHLVMDFSDFNHFFSNIGYIVLGTIFVLITKRRDYIHTMKMSKQNGIERGIPPHYGLSYSMGFGLIVEGILSACYHLCPTRMNYQFDTSFMYVIAVLCTLKLYHARHADINVKSYMAYILLALMVLLGAGTTFTSEFYFKLGFTVVHLIACVALAIDVYYMGHWKLDKEHVVEHVNTCWKSRPLYLERLTLVVVGIVCNVVFAVTVLVMDSVDFNTHILAVFMINLFVYSVFYVIMKMHKREWAFVTHRIYPFLFLLAALAFWLTGSYFFMKKAAKWEKSPAESRMLNQQCLVASVYDTHDLWHFLSSTGLFFYFMFLLTLDDDIESKSRRDIPVF